MERQHVGTPVGIDRADVGGDVVGKLSGHGVVRARKDEFLHLDRLGKSHGHGYRGHQRTECKRNHLALGHILGAGRHAGILHVALPVVAGLDGRDRRHDDRTSIGPDRPGGIEGVKVVQPFAPDHPGIAQIGLAFGRPGDADLDRRPLRSRLRRDDLHPIAAAPVDRPGAVRQRAVCRTGFSLRRRSKGGKRRDFPPLPVLRGGSMPSFRHRPPRIPPAEAPAATSGKQNCISYFLIFNRLNPRYPNSPPKSDPTHPRRAARLQTRLPPQLRRPPVPVLYKLLSYWIWLYINRDGCCIRPDRMYFAVPRSIRPYR